jgi:hypothetical protein
MCRFTASTQSELLDGAVVSLSLPSNRGGVNAQRLAIPGIVRHEGLMSNRGRSCCSIIDLAFCLEDMKGNW